VQVREAVAGGPVAFLDKPALARFARWESVTFTPDGQFALTGGSAGAAASRVIQLWATADWSEGRRLADETGGSFLRLAFGLAGDLVAAIHYGAVQVFHLTSGQPIWSAPAKVTHFVTALRVSPDGSRVAYAVGPDLRVCDLKSGKLIANPRPSRKHIQGIAFSPDGRLLATVSNDATAILWDTTRWVPVGEYTWKAGPLRSVAISPDGTLAAAGSDRGKIVVWDLDS
jgi:WD40 repeat protein